ncbi:unnamed protein product [Tuber aestivum]|uniref:Uncharacterized protein n=1 Tax=Tuber aestivum TaxID=59557 RepID=A0A292PNA5_9PEZI|nr:unnamed protein product [Tuber aestivum]
MTRDDRSALSPDDGGDVRSTISIPLLFLGHLHEITIAQNYLGVFANPQQRRREDRPATISSKVSAGLSHRSTFTENQTAANGSGDEALTTAEEDVCFSPPEESKTRGGIDFEEMEMSTCGDVIGPRYFDQIKAQEDLSAASGSVRKEGPISSPSPSNNEKAEFWNTPTIPRHRRVSNPDRFSFSSSEGNAMIHTPEIGDLPGDEGMLHERSHNTQGVWWLDCYDPTTDELAMLMKAFAIHPVTSEDIWVQETREKVELFRSYCFVCFHSFVQNKNSSDFLDPPNVYTIVFREGVLSFHFAPSPHSPNVRKLISQLRNYVALSSDWIYATR